ncbi:hypothetical protein [Pontibacter sp. 13R65]
MTLTAPYDGNCQGTLPKAERFDAIKKMKKKLTKQPRPIKLFRGKPNY